MLRLAPEIKNKFSQIQSERIDILNDILKRIQTLEETHNITTKDNINIIDEHDKEIADIKMSIETIKNEMTTKDEVKALIEDIQQTFETYLQTPRTDDNLIIQVLQNKIQEQETKINDLTEEFKNMPKLIERKKSLSSLTLKNFEKAVKK